MLKVNKTDNSKHGHKGWHNVYFNKVKIGEVILFDDGSGDFHSDFTWNCGFVKKCNSLQELAQVLLEERISYYTSQKSLAEKALNEMGVETDEAHNGL